MSPIAALDIGTTTARAGIFADGQLLAVARTRLATSHPFPGAVEQDPQAYVDTAIELLHRALAEAGVSATDLRGLGIANQRSTVVAWDARTGAALGPALGWQDTRTAARCAELRAQGIPLTTSASCSKLEWLMQNDPAVEAAGDRGDLRLGTIDTWLTWVLSGGSAHVTDPTNAGATGLYDLRSGDWSEGALALFGVPREPLGAIVGSDEVVGETDAALAGAAVPLRARIGDQQAACVAHDLAPGEAKLTLGTSAMLDLSVGAEIVEAPAGCYTLPMWRRGDEDAFMVEGSVQTAGAVMEWLVRIGILPSVEQIDEVAAAAATDVTFVPILAGLGSPHQDPDARGTITGIGLDTSRGDIVRAALAGIAARVAEVARTLEVTGVLRVDGGLSRSAVVCAMIAERTGLEIRVAPDAETTLAGAAALATASPTP